MTPSKFVTENTTVEKGNACTDLGVLTGLARSRHCVPWVKRVYVKFKVSFFLFSFVTWKLF